MKRSELKKILKPLVKECVKESILEDGVLSGIISEVVRSMPVIPDARLVPLQPKIDPVKERMVSNAFDKKQTSKLQEHKKKLMAAIGDEAYNGINLFEGTTPVSPQASPRQQAGPLSGQAPNDAGVDISGLFGAAGRNWGVHMSNVKEGK
tara:strand:- start:1521 stop:1970 length:450 start_codon:yes stop_codon:yes gene_type:complete